MILDIFHHPDSLLHEMGKDHPESPERISAILNILQKSDFQQKLRWQTSPLASKEQLLLAHHSDYIERIFSLAPKQGMIPLDPDTFMNPYTLSAALHASGGLIAAVDAVFSGKAQRAFCLSRPPGHHAEPDAAMGFCFFNHIAIGAKYALTRYHCERLAIVDFDVHHGNGTETIFSAEPKVFFWSSFQHPFYPNVQLENKPPNIHLCPLSAGTGSRVFQEKVNESLIPMLEDFKPDCIFISAGFDAHRLDPLANLKLDEQDYYFITQKICESAKRTAKGRVISTLEGGYHLQALSTSVLAHVKALLSTE